MTKLKITPTKLCGTVTVPPSKSMAHRAIICASLAQGTSRIDNIEYSKDIRATIEAMKALGTIIEEHEDYIMIDGSTTYFRNKCDIDCNESGSTLRFIIPIALVQDNWLHITGNGQLGKRPLDTYFEIFDRQNIGYLRRNEILDMYIMGRLRNDHFKIPGDISSQFISGLLFALPLLEGDSVIEITSPLQSKGYVDLTLQMLKMYGIRIINNHYKMFIIPGKQAYHPLDYRVEADYSQAAFYLAADMLGNDVTLTDLNLDSLQGDKAILDILEKMGGTLIETDTGMKMTCDMIKAADIDGSQCPDIIPMVSGVAALGNGESYIHDIGRLRIKECDRLQASNEVLNALGGQCEMDDTSLRVTGVDGLTGNDVSSYNDHRMAMMIAILTTCCNGPVVIDNKECVEKSYPSFWEDYVSLGGIIDEFDV